jgi:hypothetical protein
MYKLNAMGGVQRLSDGAFIPEDERNADWRAYQEWVAEGNTPQAADPPPAPPPSAPPPPPPEPSTRWQIDRRLVLERLDHVHRFEAFQAVLDGTTALTYALWQASQSIWNDDPLVVGLLQKAGADPATILARQENPHA